VNLRPPHYESNMGNVVADSMVDVWEDTTIAVIDDSGLRLETAFIFR
jgi:hypothetical protein